MSRIEVVAAVWQRADFFLACRRAPGKSAAGFWEFPGGKVDHDESPQDALAREVSEELGLRVKVGALLDRTVTELNGDAIDLACYFVSSTETPSSSTDHDELRWVPREELNTLDWARPDLPAVRILAAAPASVEQS